MPRYTHMLLVLYVVCVYVRVLFRHACHDIHRVESVFFHLLGSGDKTQVFRLLGGKCFIQGANSLGPHCPCICGGSDLSFLISMAQEAPLPASGLF